MPEQTATSLRKRILGLPIDPTDELPVPPAPGPVAAPQLAPQDYLQKAASQVDQGPTPLPRLRPDIGPGAYESGGQLLNKPGVGRKILSTILDIGYGAAGGPQLAEQEKGAAFNKPFNNALATAQGTEKARQQRLSEAEGIAKEASSVRLQDAQAGAYEGSEEERKAHAAQRAAEERLVDAGTITGIPDLAGVQIPMSHAYNILDKRLEKQFSTTDPEVVKEYKFAKQNGYEKGFIDYLKDKTSATNKTATEPAVDKQVLDAWLAKNPGKDASDFAQWKAALATVAGPQLSPEALNMLANSVLTQGMGGLAGLGMGNRAANIRTDVLNQAAAQGPGTDLASNTASFKANQASLTNLQKNRDAVVAFENTAGKNLDLFLQTAKSVVDSGSPIVNQPLRAISQQGLGAADLAAFNAARQIAINEIAKVTNNANLNGQLSDTARKEIETVLSPNATLGQIYAVAKTLRADMANRKTSLDQQLNDIKGRIGKGDNAQSDTETIRVRKKSTGQTGTILKKDLGPDYEEIK